MANIFSKYSNHISWFCKYNWKQNQSISMSVSWSHFVLELWIHHRLEGGLVQSSPLSSVGVPLSPHGFCKIYLSTEPQFSSSQLRGCSYFLASWFLRPLGIDSLPSPGTSLVPSSDPGDPLGLGPLWPLLGLQLHSFLASLAATQLIYSCKWRSQERKHSN